MGCRPGKRGTSFQFPSSGLATWAEIPSVMSCDSTCEMFSRQACAIQCPGIGSWPSASARHLPRFQTPRGKGVQHKPYCSHSIDGLGIVSYIYPFWGWWKPPKIQVPRHQPRALPRKPVSLKLCSQACYVSFCWHRNVIPTIFSLCHQFGLPWWQK